MVMPIGFYVLDYNIKRYSLKCYNHVCWNSERAKSLKSKLSKYKTQNYDSRKQIQHFFFSKNGVEKIAVLLIQLTAKGGGRVAWTGPCTHTEGWVLASAWSNHVLCKRIIKVILNNKDNSLNNKRIIKVILVQHIFQISHVFIHSLSKVPFRQFFLSFPNGEQQFCRCVLKTTLSPFSF